MDIVAAVRCQARQPVRRCATRLATTEELAGDEVRIGEAGNLAVLKKDEWDLLVDLIQSGQLTKV